MSKTNKADIADLRPVRDEAARQKVLDARLGISEESPQGREAKCCWSGASASSKPSPRRNRRPQPQTEEEITL